MTFRPVPKPDRPVSNETPTMNYDEPGLLELVVGDTEYRLDSGKQGTAMAISSRPVDSWDWAYLCEGKWDGRAISAKALDFDTRKALADGLRLSMEDDEE